MLFFILRKDQNVININHYKLINVFMKDKDHEGSKDNKNIIQSKKHYYKFIRTIADSISNLFYDFLDNSYLIVITLKINPTKIFTTTHLI